MLFDLDGVLVDSTPAIIQVWTAWSKANGVDPNTVLNVMHGRRSAEVLTVLAPHVNPEVEVRRIEGAITHCEHGTVAIPGAAELLRSLPHRRWAVVTSGLREFATARLKAAGLPVPDVLVAADDVVKGKPDPEPYLKGAELLGVEARECLVIEDAPAGIVAAHASGMKAVGLATTYAAEDLHDADFVVRGLQQVGVAEFDGKLRVDIQ